MVSGLAFSIALSIYKPQEVRLLPRVRIMRSAVIAILLAVMLIFGGRVHAQPNMSAGDNKAGVIETAYRLNLGTNPILWS